MRRMLLISMILSLFFVEIRAMNTDMDVEEGTDEKELVKLMASMELEEGVEEKELVKLVEKMEMLPPELQIHILKHNLPEIKSKMYRQLIQSPRTLPHKQRIMNGKFVPYVKANLDLTSLTYKFSFIDPKNNSVLQEIPIGRPFAVFTWHCISGIFHPHDEKIFALMNADGRIEIWDWQAGACLQTFENDQRIEYPMLSFSPDGRILVSASMDSEMVRLWDVKSGHCIKTLTVPGPPISNVIFHPNGKLLIIESKAHRMGAYPIRWWDIERNVCLYTSMDRTSIAEPIQSRSFTSDGKIFATMRHKDITMWDAESGRHIRTITSRNVLRDLSFSPDGKMIASVSTSYPGGPDDVLPYDGIELWDVGTGECILTLSGHRQQQHSVCFCSNGQELMVNYWDGVVEKWYLPSVLDNLQEHNLTAGQILLLHVFSQRVSKKNDLDRIDQELKRKYGGRIPELMDLKRSYFQFNAFYQGIIKTYFDVETRVTN